MLWPVFSALAIRARLFVLNPGPAFIFSVIESFTVEAQLLVTVVHHFLFCFSLLLSHSSVFSKKNVRSSMSFLRICSLVYLCMIHGQGVGFQVLHSRVRPWPYPQTLD